MPLFILEKRVDVIGVVSFLHVSAFWRPFLCVPLPFSPSSSSRSSIFTSFVSRYSSLLRYLACFRLDIDAGEYWNWYGLITELISLVRYGRVKAANNGVSEIKGSRYSYRSLTCIKKLHFPVLCTVYMHSVYFSPNPKTKTACLVTSSQRSYWLTPPPKLSANPALVLKKKQPRQHPKPVPP